jgi:hypothetical protein
VAGFLIIIPPSKHVTGFLIIIPPSKAATCGAVADKKIPAIPNVRTPILTTFFMGVFSFCD